MAITHNEIVSMLKRSRSIVTDDFALQTIDVFPFWKSMIGVEITQEDIQKGYDRYQYNGELYAVIQPHTPQKGWEPDKVPALWKKVSLEEWPEFKQPTGAHDAYNIGDHVTYQGEHYISNINGNTTVPGSDDRWWTKVES